MGAICRDHMNSAEKANEELRHGDVVEHARS